MKEIDLYKHIDYTLLKPFSTYSQIDELCQNANIYNTASVCIPPSFVKFASDKYKNICTVIGFPNGYNTKSVKLFETEQALNDGASEIDMVINVGNVKSGRFDLVFEEIFSLKSLCGDNILKVIIETAYLTKEEKIKMCNIITDAKADYIKTSTGFAPKGATFDDIELFKKHIGTNVKIKAAGGIRTYDDMVTYIKLGCSRIGASTLPKKEI
jgi:deoxyribose-phosphate aldolase